MSLKVLHKTVESIPSLPQPRPQATVEGVAKILAFSSEKVRQLCREGELQYTGVGRGFRIFLDSVADYQERQLQKIKDGR